MIGKPLKKHRLPLKFIDGQFELEIGGAVPLVEGARCELTVAENQITDAGLLRDLQSKKSIKILDKGTKLVAMLSGRFSNQIPDKLRSSLLPEDFGATQLGNWFDRWDKRSSLRNFVKIEVGSANDRQMKFPEFQDGGLWLQVQGWRAVGLEASQINLPDSVSEVPATSLNHAFTLLSEAFEPWRISHTGNIYEQILYQEGNGKWYPLNFLRDDKELEEGQNIAKGHWDRFLKEMKPPTRES